MLSAWIDRSSLFFEFAGLGIIQTKKAVPLRERLFENKSWRCPTLTWGDPTLPSALSVFTSEFGMGSGGSRSLLPPGKLVGKKKNLLPGKNNNLDKFLMSRVYFSVALHVAFTPRMFWCYMAKPHGQLVLVSFTHYCASTPSLSTS